MVRLQHAALGGEARRLTLGLSLACAVLAAAATTHAQETPASPTPTAAPKPWRDAMARAPIPETPEPGSTLERSWYGWQTLGVDVLSVSFTLASEGELVLASLAGLVLAAPVVHFAHSKLTEGFISLGVRGACGGVFVLGIFLLFDDFLEEGDGNDNENLGAAIAIAGVAGTVAMIAVDAAVFAFETRPKPNSRQGTALTPWLDPRHGSYGVRFALAL